MADPYMEKLEEIQTQLDDIAENQKIILVQIGEIDRRFEAFEKKVSDLSTTASELIGSSGGVVKTLSMIGGLMGRNGGGSGD